MITHPATRIMVGNETLTERVGKRQVYSIQSVDHIALREADSYIRARVREDLVHQIAAFIAHDTVEETKKAFHTEFKMTQFILTHDDVYALIEYGRELQRVSPIERGINERVLGTPV